jgi:integrase
VARAAFPHGDRQATGRRWVETGLVFTTEIGTPLDGRYVTHEFQGVLRRAGVRHQRFHDLRHGCASLLIAQGIHSRVVMDILGHSTLDMTTGLDAHTTLELQREVMDRLDEAIARNKWLGKWTDDEADRPPPVSISR